MKNSLYISVKSIWSRTLFNATISLLIFCFENLSILGSGVLKSSTIIVVLSISFLKSSKIFFMYLGAPMLGAYVFNVYVFLMDSSLEYFDESFWVSLYGAFFWSPFCLIWLLLPWLFFPVHLLGIFFFQPFTFGMYRSFFLRWVSCRQPMCGEWFLVHSAILCFLIGAINPFSFKVIIDRYLFIYLPL